MNRYGQMAMDYNRRFLPAAFAEIPSPEAFFAAAGEEIEAAISEMRDQILGRPRAGENPEDYRLRSYQALRMAEEVVLADHHLLTAEPESRDEDPAPEEDPELDGYYRDLATVNEAITKLYE